MASTSRKCTFCNKGFFVEEYHLNINKTDYYCNHCFKYEKREEEKSPLAFGPVADLTEEELDAYLDEIFNDYPCTD